MNTEEKKMLEPLKHINKVDPSDQLFSAIENKIRIQQTSIIPVKKLLAASVVLIVLIASNSFLIKSELKQHNSNSSRNSELTETFGINSSNQLYND